MKSLWFFLAGAALILGGALATATAQEPGQEEAPDSRPRLCVVLDPGHGGLDQGAGIAGGVKEKTAVLAFARTLAETLGPDFIVEKTRDSDLGISPADRAGTANHAHAALFVSIHAGLGWAGEADRVFIYVDRTEAPDPGGAATPAWDQLQASHRQESRSFAESACAALSAAGAGISCEVRDLPLPVLAGADMPAVLLDFPLPRLSRPEPLAQALAGAIRSFLGTAE